MASCGYDPEDVPDAPPIAPGGGNAWHIAGHYAYMAILAALYYRDMSGEGQYVDASIHEACALTTESAVAIYLSTGEVVRRHTGRAASPDQSAPTQLATKGGGWVNVTRSGSNLTPPRLRRLAEWMDGYGLARDLLDDKYQAAGGVEENAFHVTQVVAEFFAQLSQEEIWHGGQQRDLPWGAVRTVDEIMDDPHLEDRGFFVEVEHPELDRSFVYPGAAAIYNGSPWRISRRAPLVGEHNEEVLCGELGVTREEMILLAESETI
jgi:benzylsuccinate CoA-transferase BbsE subunit